LLPPSLLSYGGKVVADAPRNDRRTPPHSRGAISPGAYVDQRPSKARGHRECRMPSCTRSLACEKQKAHERSHYRSAENSGIPCAMVLRLIRDLPGVPGLLATIAPRSPAKLDSSVGEPGPHDFAVRQRSRAPRDPIGVHHILNPTSVATRARPSWRVKTREAKPLICPTAQVVFL
jgi:hypothetical protein